MKKDYSKLFQNEDDEKEIEEKYSQFLDWLVENIDNDMFINISKIRLVSKFIPTEFNEILHEYHNNGQGRIILRIKPDIDHYLYKRHIKIRSSGKDENRKILLELEIINNIYFSNPNYRFYKQNLDIDMCKSNIADMSKRIFDLENENTSIMKKFEEQIELNSKLCQRIFEMKEEKFKEVIINKPITSFPDEIYALQNKIRILEEMIKDRI